MSTTSTILAKTLSPEEEYASITPVGQRKKYAQFFTPPIIAEVMAEWVLKNAELNTILEPAFGLGIFSRTLLESKPDLSITGYEIDRNILSAARDLFSTHPNVELRNKDYIFSPWDQLYDGILCNPPYFKFHDYDNKPALEEFSKVKDFELSGFTNLHSLFLLKSAHQLKPSGRAAYIVPSEFLNSDYGKRVKRYLLSSGTLRHILIIDFKENVFDDALTTASIILLANDSHHNSVQFTEISTLQDLNIFRDTIQRYPNFSGSHIHRSEDLDPNAKWRNYFEQQHSSQFSALVPFTKFGKVSRGIATGSNDYFVFNKSRAEKEKLKEKYLLPCIVKSSDVANTFFSYEDFLDLKKRDRNVYLFNGLNAKDPHVSSYIEAGEKDEIHKKYLTASRKPWYSLENRPPSPIWVGVFNRNGLRFVRNTAGISNLTTFHSVYIQPGYEEFTDLFFAYLLTPTARRILEENRREYGNGLQKFEPNDLNGSKVLDLELIHLWREKEILRVLEQFKDTSAGNEKDLLLQELDKLFLDSFAEL